MSAFFSRILQLFAGDALIKALANNRSFQRFAVSTDSFIKKNLINAKQAGEEAVKNAIKNGEKISGADPPKTSSNQSASKLFRFAKALHSELKKDLRL
mmetsp:Transcript_9803/g.9895  ORF Transcript_9803/g.9895 Transcript_9803/m.9895 type:complete len:98 (-) Transcript_9803:259-552(-)